VVRHFAVSETGALCAMENATCWLNSYVSETIESVQRLSANDRCDVCGAQAYIRALLDSGELLFCAHHGNANREKLESLIISWHDQTEDLARR
jgi:hypothetical protein